MVFGRVRESQSGTRWNRREISNGIVVVVVVVDREAVVTRDGEYPPRDGECSEQQRENNDQHHNRTRNQ